MKILINLYLYILISSLFLLLQSCGKNKQQSAVKSSSYWQEKGWDYLDNDADGISNADEIKVGTHPELITAPNLKNFAISNINFFIKGNSEKLNARPLQMENRENDANIFLYKLFAPISRDGELPFQSFEFKKEHVTLLSEHTFRLPHIGLIQPKPDAAYLQFLKNYFYNKNTEETKFQGVKTIQARLTLNFATNLNQGPWQKIEGQFIWGENTIPWTWEKSKTSQVHWQIEVSIDQWLEVIKRNNSAQFHILRWEVSTPNGVRSFDQKYLSTLTPFYVISSNGSEAGWYNTNYPLPAEIIIKRPTENHFSSPWYFLKLENTKDKTSSYWLKELTDNEVESIQTGKSFKKSLIHNQEDHNFLELPPNSSVNALKISMKSVKYIYPKYVHHKMVPHYQGNQCASFYPDFSPHNPSEVIHSLNVNRLLERIVINSIPLRELINSHIYLTFEYDQNNVRSLVLHWDKSFIWKEFTIQGLKHDIHRIEFNHKEGPICDLIIDSPNRNWPMYKSEEIFLEWII